ncbi:MAG TPA: phenylalanine--tRNA ligase subunit alpha [Anaerolineae bacterium]|nr:phenylalanine--tRNA ligase subunit alpha [Anaerolineae bacterium]
MSQHQKLIQLQTQAENELADAKDARQLEAWRIKWLGRKGLVPAAVKKIGSLPKEERAAYGQAVNRLKQAVQAAFEARQQQLKEAAMAAELRAEGFDPTLPGRRPQIGRLHPSSATLREIAHIFAHMGFEVYTARDVETDEYNFQLLNFPKGHPAREMQDTFHTTTPDVLLRTHTSPGQIRVMRERYPEPIRVILPGKCYRYEQVTARSEMMFHQIEGLAVGKHITFADLKGTLQAFVEQLFGEGRKLRFRASHFPFTEPSAEVDVDCILCGGKGCRVCKYTGWLEILGCGMVHPNVLRNGGYDPEEWSGYAFGMGPERIAMLLHGVDDIRYFYSNDVRFLEQF